jgi:hypothetical protein
MEQLHSRQCRCNAGKPKWLLLGSSEPHAVPVASDARRISINKTERIRSVLIRPRLASFFIQITIVNLIYNLMRGRSASAVEDGCRLETVYIVCTWRFSQPDNTRRHSPCPNAQAQGWRQCPTQKPAPQSDASCLHARSDGQRCQAHRSRPLHAPLRLHVLSSLSASSSPSYSTPPHQHLPVAPLLHAIPSPPSHL